MALVPTISAFESSSSKPSSSVSMAPIDLPEDFQCSLRDCHNFPENLSRKSTSIYKSGLQSYKRRLDDVETDLCLVENQDDIELDFEVPFRDLATATGKEVDKRNIHSPEDVTKWLGLQFTTNSTNPGQQLVRATKRDPQSRFIYIYAEHSRDQLKITRRSLVQILTYHQVMPIYLDFMLIFGAQSDPRDLRFTGFRETNLMKDPARGHVIPELGRSGRHFQMCYNLKGVAFKKKDDENIKLNEWSIRQAAVYHHFDVVYGTTLWIVTKGRLDIQQRYKELTGPDGRIEDRSFGTLDESFRSSLSAHLLYCNWSAEEWRWYIRWLEDVIDDESAMAVYGPRGPGYAHQEYTPFHIQDLQYWQDKTNEAVMVLESNIEVITALGNFYNNLDKRNDFPDLLKNKSKEDIELFVAQLDEITNDFRMQASRAKLLANIISDRKELVLQHLQGQAADRTEQLNINLEREAVVMRIITLVTLLYLPATFVSTFFGTDVIKYQGDGGRLEGDGSFSPVAMRRWLQVTVPLTALTLLIAWTTYRFAERTKQSRKTSPALKTLGSGKAGARKDPEKPGVPLDAQTSSSLTWFKPPGWGWSSMSTRLSRQRSPHLPLHKSSQDIIT